MIDDPFKVIAADILYKRNEQLKRDLIKKAHEADKAKWARLDEQHLTKGETKMKQNLLLAALLAATFNSYATERGNPSQGGQATSNAAAGSLAVAGAAALSSSGALASSGGGSASVGDLTVNGDDYDAKRIPVSSAIAPNTHQNGDCPFISPSTKAIQLPFAGGSGTTGVTLNTICVAKWLGQHEVVERMACNADDAYRKANPNCGE